MESRKTKLIAVSVVLVLLAIFVPPNINGTRFRDRLAPALSAALGRQVKIGAVKYRLFPRPGFDLYDFQVMDDPVFGAEPLLMCGKVTADLRLTSLWQGRLEIANLKLTDDGTPPSLNLAYANGHWNLEPLLVRAEQVPSAPTARRRAEQRPRFPYIEASGGRINFKKGTEKKSYTITNTDFAFWLAAENEWHFRLEGRPVRTDMNLNGTGVVKAEGDLRRSGELRDMPVKLNLSWEKTQLGQFSKLISGQDHGWRGDLEGSASVSGTMSNLHLTAAADVSHFHRYDVNRDTMPRLHTRCLGDYAKNALDLKCDAPLAPGGVLLTIHWAAATPWDYDLSVVADHVPMAMLATAARQARASLPDDFTANGDLNAAFGFHSRNGQRDWHGTGMTSPFVLQSAIVEKPFPVSPIRFHVGAQQTSTAPKRGKTPVPAAAPSVPSAAGSDSFTVDSFSVQLGPSSVMDVQGTFDRAGYRFFVRGLVPLERAVALGKVAGLAGDSPVFSASAIVDFNIAGGWSDSARARGTAKIQNLTAWIPGVKNRLVLTQAEAQLTDASLVVSHINGEFEHSPVAFTGSAEKPWSTTCGNGSDPCALAFDLHSAKLAVADLRELIGLNDNAKGWLPFLTSSSAKFPSFRAKGTLSADEFTLARIPLQKFTGKIEFADNKLVLTEGTAKLAGGGIDGEWRADWSGSQPRFSSSGTLTGVDLGRLGTGDEDEHANAIAAWLSGRAQVKYALQFDGKTPQEMFASASGRAEFSVAVGDSRALTLQGDKPLRYQSAQGVAELEKSTLNILPSKIKSENRIYEVSGKVSLAEHRAALKVSSGGLRWEVTGALDNPQVASPPLTVQTTSAQRQ